MPATPGPNPGSGTGPAPANAQHKARTGLRRIWHAAGYSLCGLRSGWQEKAFRQAALAALLLLPLAPWLGRNWVEAALLAAVLLLVLIVELLNTALESAVDRIGVQWHELAGRAKDLASAAVLLALLLCLGVWLTALWQRFGNFLTGVVRAG